MPAVRGLLAHPGSAASGDLIDPLDLRRAQSLGCPLEDTRHVHPGSWIAHSVAARAKRQTGNGHGSGLIREHVVPMHLLLKELLSGPPERARYYDILNRLAVVALITKEEDQRLFMAGLQTHHPDLSDPWARYEAVGIEMEGDFPPGLNELRPSGLPSDAPGPSPSQ